MSLLVDWPWGGDWVARWPGLLALQQGDPRHAVGQGNKL
jgi:hypothetical protein